MPEASATIDGADVLKELVPGTNHKSIAKFSSRAQKGYKIIVHYLQNCLKNHSNKRFIFMDAEIDDAVNQC